MAKLVVAFAGPDNVGKTTAALQLQAVGFAKFSMAGPAKEILKEAACSKDLLGRKEVASVYQYLIDKLGRGLEYYWNNILYLNTLIVIDDLRRDTDLGYLTCNKPGKVIVVVIRKNGDEVSELKGCSDWTSFHENDHRVAAVFEIHNDGSEEELRVKVFERVFAYIAQRGVA